MHPKARCAQAPRLAQARTRTHTLKHTRTLALMFSVGAWVQSCDHREGEPKWASLLWRLGRSAGLLRRPPDGQEGKRMPHTARVVSPFSQKISAKGRLPGAFGKRLLSGAEERVLGEVMNLGHLDSLATCFAQFSMELWTHRTPGPTAFFPSFYLFFKCMNLKGTAKRHFAYFGG